MFKLFLSIVRAYTLASLILSALVSGGVSRWEIIENRFPFVIMDVAAVTVEGDDTLWPDDLHMFGYDQHGEYVGFSSGANVGDKVLCLMIYNPLNNYCDDIMIRFDMPIP